MNAETNLDTMKEMGTKAMENLKKLAELNMKTLDKVTSRQKEAMDFMMEQTKRQMELATTAKGFDDFIKQQGELTKDIYNDMLQKSKENMEMMSDFRNEYSAFIKEEVDKLSNKFRKATPGM